MIASLVSDNIAYAQAILWRRLQPTHGSAPEFADRVTDAVHMGLCVAATRYKPGGRSSFLTFAVRRCMGEFIDDVRRECGRPGENGIRSKTHLIDRDYAVNDPDSVDMQDYLEVLSSKLSRRHRHVLRRKLEGTGFLEIAKDLGVSDSRVSQLFSEVRRIASEMGSPW